jgi:hypothetical protein
LKKAIGLLLVLILALVGCSDKDAETTTKEALPKGDYTHIDGDEVKETINLPIGQTATFIYPESEFLEEKKIEFTIQGVDFLTSLETEPYAGEQNDFLVMDFSVKNIGENKVSYLDYPTVIIHNTTGQEETYSLEEGLQYDSVSSFSKEDLLPGGETSGLVVIPLEEGASIKSIFLEPFDILGEFEYPFALDISNLRETASDSPTQLTETLNEKRETFLMEEFAEFDSKVVDDATASFTIPRLQNYNLIAEPNDIGFNMHDTKEYFAEFIRDNGKITGVKFTEQ